ncbi:1621_t:CDS:2, partial [Racocetra persica]
YPHQSGNKICYGQIKKKSCEVEFYKITPLDLKANEDLLDVTPTHIVTDKFLFKFV